MQWPTSASAQSTTLTVKSHIRHYARGPSPDFLFIGVPFRQRHFYSFNDTSLDLPSNHCCQFQQHSLTQSMLIVIRWTDSYRLKNKDRQCQTSCWLHHVYFSGHSWIILFRMQLKTYSQFWRTCLYTSFAIRPFLESKHVVNHIMTLNLQPVVIHGMKATKQLTRLLTHSLR